jgi:hypothetical protein
VDREKRKGEPSIPVSLEVMLNKVQLQALPGIEFLGWKPWFFRKSLFMAPVLVMHNSNDGRIGILDENGRIRIQTDIKVREEENLTQTPTPPNNLHYF